MEKKPRKISLLGSRVTSALSVTLVLIIIGLCITLGVTVRRATSSVTSGTTIMITLNPEEDEEVTNAMKRMFNDAPWVEEYEFSSKTEVLSREFEGMDEITREGLSLLSENPYGDEFVLYLSQGWRNGDSIAAITKRLNDIDAVDIVSEDASLMGKTNDSVRQVLLYMSALGIVLLLISIALIKNTISLSIYSRRFTINTMKLVGATNAFIRRPFVRAGMLTGLIAGLSASLAVCGLQLYLMYNDRMVGQWITATDIVLTGVILVVSGAFIARGAAWWSATTYLKKNYDELFKN